LYNYIGLIFTDKEEYDSAIFYIQKSLELNRKYNDQNEILDNLINISIAYQGKEQYEESNETIHEALDIAQELNDIKKLKSCYSILAENYEKLGMVDKSYEYFNMAASFAKHLQEQAIRSYEYKTRLAEAEISEKEKQLLTKSEDLKEANKKNQQIALQVELLSKEKELKELALKEEEARSRELEAREKARKITNYYFGGGLIISIIFFIILYWQLKEKKKSNTLLGIRNDEIKHQKEEIEAQRDIANHQKQKITSSIRYAKQIQSAILPPDNFIKKILPENFILYKPKDIVSGDFYWITEKEGVIIIAAADCTGHGVPGAFMSMLGIAFLNEIVNKIGINKHIRAFKASEVLNQLRDQVIQSLHQDYDMDHLKDGMDISLCILDIEHRHLQYAGAHNPVYIIRNSELIQLTADKMPIGIYKSLNESFKNHEIDIEIGDYLYLFSDGYYDQFGGEENKKYMIKSFKELLLEIHQKPMQEQLSVLENTIEDYKGENDQMDDMLIIGIKITKQVKKYAKDRMRNWESKRILIAEDTDINYFLLVEALKPTNAQIFRADNGQEAVDFCMNNEVDIVLMDINMPVLNGLEATRKIRDFNKNIPIIAQTAQSQPDDPEKCKQAGCNDYISKPIDLKTFLNKIEEQI
ncbi:response regulator, partial [Bacteroidota bacterium]